MARGGPGHQDAWRLPGGPFGPPARWASTSSVEVGQTTYPVNRRRERRVSHKEDEREGGKGIGPRVPSYATADGASLPAQPGPV